jgi:hypothetical protein
MITLDSIKPLDLEDLNIDEYSKLYEIYTFISSRLYSQDGSQVPNEDIVYVFSKLVTELKKRNLLNNILSLYKHEDKTLTEKYLLELAKNKFTYFNIAQQLLIQFFNNIVKLDSDLKNKDELKKK